MAEDLDAASHNAAKVASYVRAIQAWNRFDVSRRKRITMPLRFGVSFIEFASLTEEATSATFAGLTDDSPQSSTDYSPPS